MVSHFIFRTVAKVLFPPARFAVIPHLNCKYNGLMINSANQSRKRPMSSGKHIGGTVGKPAETGRISGVR